MAHAKLRLDLYFDSTEYVSKTFRPFSDSKAGFAQAHAISKCFIDCKTISWNGFVNVSAKIRRTFPGRATWRGSLEPTGRSRRSRNAVNAKSADFLCTRTGTLSRPPSWDLEWRQPSIKHMPYHKNKLSKYTLGIKSTRKRKQVLP